MIEKASAQDIIDTMRILRTAQKDPSERDDITNLLLDLAPATDGDSGFDIVRELIAEGALKTQVVDYEPFSD